MDDDDNINAGELVFVTSNQYGVMRITNSRAGEDCAGVDAPLWLGLSMLTTDKQKRRLARQRDWQTRGVVLTRRVAGDGWGRQQIQEYLEMFGVADADKIILMVQPLRLNVVAKCDQLARDDRFVEYMRLIDSGATTLPPHLADCPDLAATRARLQKTDEIHLPASLAWRLGSSPSGKAGHAARRPRRGRDDISDSLGRRLDGDLPPTQLTGPS